MERRAYRIRKVMYYLLIAILLTTILIILKAGGIINIYWLLVFGLLCTPSALALAVIHTALLICMIFILLGLVISMFIKK